MMEQQIVSISLQSTMKQDSQKDVMKKKYTGKMIYKDYHWYIRYRDKTAGPITIKYDDKHDIVTVLYANYAMKKMIFQKNEQTQTIYQLPQGQLVFTIQTQMIQTVVRSEKLRELTISYQLYQENQLFGEYFISYKIR